MRISIFGASGFLGSNFLKYLTKVDVLIFNRNEIKNSTYFIDNESKAIINFAGKAHDLKKSKIDNEYYDINTRFCIKLYQEFLNSKSEVFITISSVKAVADVLNIILTEETIPNPLSTYGKSKLLAENFILSKAIPNGKRVYILRPCMIHGPGNKGNLNLLYKIVSKDLPWPLGAFENKRSFCSIDNLFFVINELIENNQIPSGVYNIADDEPISTNELIGLIANIQNKKSKIFFVSKLIIKALAKFGDLFNLPLNTERLTKLTETYVVSNDKIKKAINKPLPVSTRSGLIKTFNSFNNNV